MPQKKSKRKNCIDYLRHSEYYDQQDVYDDLYSRSKNGEKFDKLMDVVLSRENILLAYRNIKTNAGSKTPGTDHVTIQDIGCLAPEEVIAKVRYIVAGSKHGYRPKPVRRKDIPKPDGSTRPLGIPCMWDRLVQQCIKQVLEPICEAKFSENSYGFRPGRSAEHAIASAYKMLQVSHLHYVVEFDIKSFFDEVDQVKLIKQLWALGIQDKHLIWVIKRSLKAPVKMPDGTQICPEKGTPQGGILSPLLANVVLNELDCWIESQWQNHPVVRKYSSFENKSGSRILTNGYRAMKQTNLKEMRIVRYADDFRIFCRTKDAAERTRIAVTQWLKERLKLDVASEKTRVIDAKRRYFDFLGFKVKVQLKGGKYVVESRLCDKSYKRVEAILVRQAKKVARPKGGRNESDEIRLYNHMVVGTQNYYRFATNVNIDCDKINRRVMTVFTNRLIRGRSVRLKRKGRDLTPVERMRYGKSALLRYLAGTGDPIYPIGCVQHQNPMHKQLKTNCFTKEGRKKIHDNLQVNTSLMLKMMKQPLHGRSIEYADNRISLFSAQWGKCAVTGREFRMLEDIHCHHIIPREMGGTDEYSNLVLVLAPIHVLIHAVRKQTIDEYTENLKLGKEEIANINKYRRLAHRTII